MNRLIVTGANGFVGSNIVSSFLEAGWAVCAIDRHFDNPAYSRLDAAELRLVGVDCAALPPLSADALIHAAFVTADPATRGESPEANLRQNIEPLLSTLEYVKGQRIKRAIFLSSNAVFHSAPATLIDETRPPQPRGVYAVAKSLLEQAVDTFRRDYGRDVVCARLGAVYGPYEFPRSTRTTVSLVARMFTSALSTGLIDVHHPDERRQWTFAPDIGRALLTLLNATALNHSLYHLASKQQLANREIATQIGQLLDDVRLRIAPAGDQPEPPRRNLGLLDNSRLRRDTGFTDWSPMNAATLGATLASFRSGAKNA